MHQFQAFKRMNKPSAFVLVSCCVFLATLLLLFNSHAFAKTTLTVAIPWGDPVHEFNGVFPALVEAYAEIRPDVEIEFLPSWGMDKIIAAWAGGALPDIVFAGAASEEMREVFLPLDDMMERKGVQLSDYLPGSVGQMNIMGQTWTLQVFIDPNFPLIYNKTLFAQSGLNPEEAPTTVADFDELFHRLTRRNAEGEIVQIAMPPWMWKDEMQIFNALTFGSAFGATLWEGTETEGQLGLTSPEMVEAFEWLKGYHDQFAADAAGLVAPGFGSFVGRMIEGQQAMVMWITPFLKHFRVESPQYEWGAASPFYKADGGFEYPIWFGGWGAGVTRQSNHQDEAFDFLAFMSHSPEGQEILSRVGELFPATKESPGFVALIEETPEWVDFISALRVSTLSPATYWLNLEWGQAFESVSHRIFNEGVAPIIALQEAENMLALDAEELGIIVH